MDNICPESGWNHYIFDKDLFYEGEFSQGKRHGVGKLTNKTEGWSITGKFVSGEVSGFAS